LQRTTLPTLLVEGEDDAAIYRWLEGKLGVFSGSILFCTGRNVLISIYRKRETFPHGKIAWLADLDMWKFTASPVDLTGIIFTTGYSIENDLYDGSQIESLLEAAEKSRYSNLLTVLSRWFAFEVQEFKAGRDPHVAHHVREIVDLPTMDLSPRFA